MQGGKPFIHIFDYDVEGALVAGADAEHMAEIASYELERMKDMDAYIDIRATTNISMWHNISDEALRRYRQYYWGPIHLDQRCNHTKWSVLRYPNGRYGPVGRHVYRGIRRLLLPGLSGGL